MTTEIMKLAAALTTAELETLIADLAELRAGMTPPVSQHPPRPGEQDQNISCQDEPAMQARLLRDGRIRLWIRNAGLGWLVFNLAREQAVTLREFLRANTDPDAIPALFGDNDGEGQAPH